MATTVTVKGQVTIPKAVRDAVGIKPGDRVDIEVDRPGRRVLIQHSRAAPSPEALAEARRSTDAAIAFAQKHRVDLGMTPEELWKLLRGDD